MTKVNKFRAWNKKWKRMIDNVLANLDIVIWTFDADNSTTEWDYLSDDIKVMQFTGLFDNTKFEELTTHEQNEWLQHNKQEDWKGKEIYEGDLFVKEVLMYQDGENRSHGTYWLICKCIVTFNCGKFCGEYKFDIPDQANIKRYIDIEKFTKRSGFTDISGIQILGNIYQNPELLESK